MLYLTLPPALILVLAAHYAARRAPHPTRWAAFLVPGLGLSFVPVCIGLLMFPVILLFLFLAVALGVWPLVHSRVRTFLPFSAVAVLVAYGVTGWPALKLQTEYARLRTKYPYESMEDRAPTPRAQDRGGPLSEATDLRLAGLEQQVEYEGLDGRRYQLQEIHEDAVRLFVNSPGFGVTRMRRPSAAGLDPRPRDEAPLQPASPLPPGKYQPGAGRLPADEVEGLGGLHADGVLDFVNARGFGFVRDRRHAAGFLPHGFGRLPSSSRTPLRVRRVELVGLLRHAEPVVYVTDRLPMMDEVKAAPTRPLDEFETAGLRAVRRGEDVVAARTQDVVRAVGGMRSVKQCVECHGGERGDLLGAFSYVLGPD